MRNVARAGLVLVGLAQCVWASLAFPNAPTIWMPLAGKGVAFLAAAAWFDARGARNAAFVAAGVAELAFIALFPGGFGPVETALSLAELAGPVAMVWRMRGGALVGGAGVYGYALFDVMQGSTLLAGGYLFALPGWALVLWALWRGAPTTSGDHHLAQAGARP